MSVKYHHGKDYELRILESLGTSGLVKCQTFRQTEEGSGGGTPLFGLYRWTGCGFLASLLTRA